MNLCFRQATRKRAARGGLAKVAARESPQQIAARWRHQPSGSVAE